MNSTKKILAVAALVLSWCWSVAQVGAFPYQQSFETAFTPGGNFAPNWWGNKMVSGIMGQYQEGHTGTHSLYMIPNEGEDIPIFVQVALDLSGKNHTYAGFWIATRKNGTDEDQKRSRVTVSVSTDGGATFGFSKKIGSERGFENLNSAFQYFEYPLPPAAVNNPNVVLRFTSKAGGGPHLPARLLIDDITIDQAHSDIFAPFIVGELKPKNFGVLEIQFSEPLLPAQANNPQNYVFGWPTEGPGATGHGAVLPQVTQAQFYNLGNQYVLRLRMQPPLVQGEYYTLALNNVYDLNGNFEDFEEELVYNIPNPGDLVISEVFFADPSPAHGIHRLQFVEIFNAAPYPVPLGGLRIKGAIAAHDMPNIRLKPREYYVITRQAPAFLQTFGFPAWEWKGSWIENISEDGEPLEAQELYIQTTDHHDAPYVDYVKLDFPSPLWAPLNVDAYSIEVCYLRADNNHVGNWALAVEDDNLGEYIYTYEGVDYQIYASPGRSRFGEISCGFENGMELLRMCHETDYGFMTVCVRLDQVGSHLAHGDFLGDCEGGCDGDTDPRSIEELVEAAAAFHTPATRVFPNPASNQAWVSIRPDRGHILRMELVNLMGQKVKTLENLYHRNIEVPLAGLPKGIYLLHVRGDQVDETHKLTIE